MVIRYVHISYFHQIVQRVAFIQQSRKTNALCNVGDRKNWLMCARLNWRPMFHKAARQWAHVRFHYRFFRRDMPNTYAQVQHFLHSCPLKSTYKFTLFMSSQSLLSFVALGTSSIAVNRLPACGNAITDCQCSGISYNYLNVSYYTRNHRWYTCFSHFIQSNGLAILPNQLYTNHSQHNFDGINNRHVFGRFQSTRWQMNKRSMMYQHTQLWTFDQIRTSRTKTDILTFICIACRIHLHVAIQPTSPIGVNDSFWTILNSWTWLKLESIETVYQHVIWLHVATSQLSQFEWLFFQKWTKHSPFYSKRSSTEQKPINHSHEFTSFETLFSCVFLIYDVNWSRPLQSTPMNFLHSKLQFIYHC